MSGFDQNSKMIQYTFGFENKKKKEKKTNKKSNAYHPINS
jgi:hypothetical protein